MRPAGGASGGDADAAPSTMSSRTCSRRIDPRVRPAVEAAHQVRGAAGELLDGVESAAGDVDADDAGAVEIRVVGDAHIRVAREHRILQHEPAPRRVGERELGRAHVAGVRARRATRFTSRAPSRRSRCARDRDERRRRAAEATAPTRRAPRAGRARGSGRRARATRRPNSTALATPHQKKYATTSVAIIATSNRTRGVAPFPRDDVAREQQHHGRHEDEAGERQDGLPRRMERVPGV